MDTTIANLQECVRRGPPDATTPPDGTTVMESASLLAPPLPPTRCWRCSGSGTCVSAAREQLLRIQQRCNTLVARVDLLKHAAAWEPAYARWLGLPGPGVTVAPLDGDNTLAGVDTLHVALETALDDAHAVQPVSLQAVLARAALQGMALRARFDDAAARVKWDTRLHAARLVPRKAFDLGILHMLDVNKLQGWPPVPPLGSAIHEGRLDDVKTLLAWGPGVARWLNTSYGVWTAVSHAVTVLDRTLRANAHEPQCLLTCAPEPVDTKPAEAVVCCLVRDPASQKLLRSWARVDNTRVSLLDVAVRCSTTDVLNAVLAVSPEWYTIDKDAAAACLRTALVARCTTNALWLLEHVPDVDVNATDRHKHTPLMLAAAFYAEKGTHEVFDALLKLPTSRGLDLNAQNVIGSTALIVAAKRCWNKAAVRALLELPLERGLDVNARDEKGKTAVMHAVELAIATMQRHIHVVDSTSTGVAQVFLEYASGRLVWDPAFVRKTWAELKTWGLMDVPTWAQRFCALLPRDVPVSADALS